MMRRRLAKRVAMKFFKRNDKKKGGGGGFLEVPGENGTHHSTFGGGAGGRGGDMQHTTSTFYDTPRPTPASTRLMAQLPAAILERIFALVCPQSRDESYETCEESSIEDACMLCDMRDLAHCAAVNKVWRESARKLLYHSIRIDPVHYCEREGPLADMRKRRSFFNRNGEPEDTAAARIKLLCRTLREDPTRLGVRVQFLKTPYMLRESCQADLARTIAVLPNLRYVDLPEGLFADDPAFLTLRLEVQARCPDLRKMTYMRGAERSLELLAAGKVFRKLEVLELIRVDMDPIVLRHVLGALGNLRALKVSETRSFGDDIFAWGEGLLPHFPALTELILKKTPKVTEKGLVQFLGRRETRSALQVLTLWKTGVDPTKLQDILEITPALKTLAIRDTVSKAITSGAGIKRLASPSLRILRFEISASSNDGPHSSTSASYYTYLASSILNVGFPRLRAVYVGDPNFPDQLLGISHPPLPPLPPFSQNAVARPLSSSSNTSPSFLSPRASGFTSPQYRPDTTNRFSSNNPFAGARSLSRTLEVFTKGDEGMDWSFIKVSPQPRHARGQSTGMSVALGGGANGTPERPKSSYGLGSDVTGTGWNSGGARRSVMVANGAGGFLAVPTDGGGGDGEELWPRPKSSGGEKRRGDRNLWR